MLHRIWITQSLTRDFSICISTYALAQTGVKSSWPLKCYGVKGQVRKNGQQALCFLSTACLVLFSFFFTLPEYPAGTCILLVSSFFTLPEYPAGSCLTRFFFILPASVLRTDVSCFPTVLSFFLSLHIRSLNGCVLMCPVCLPLFLSFFTHLFTERMCSVSLPFFLSFFCQHFKSQ